MFQKNFLNFNNNEKIVTKCVEDSRLFEFVGEIFFFDRMSGEIFDAYIVFFRCCKTIVPCLLNVHSTRVL